MKKKSLFHAPVKRDQRVFEQNRFDLDNEQKGNTKKKKKKKN